MRVDSLIAFLSRCGMCNLLRVYYFHRTRNYYFEFQKVTVEQMEKSGEMIRSVCLPRTKITEGQLNYFYF